MTDTPAPPPSPVIDAQDPLPEANWLWRRVFTFIAMAVIFAILIGLAVATNRIVTNVVGRIDTMSAVAVAEIAKQALVVILRMFTLMFWALMVTITYYMVAPSAEQITKMMQTAGLLKAGVQFATRSVDTGDKREVASTAGQPPQPIAPPVLTATEAPEAPAPEPEALDAPKSGQEGEQESHSGSEGPEVAPDLPPASTGLKIDTILKGDSA